MDLVELYAWFHNDFDELVEIKFVDEVYNVQIISIGRRSKDAAVAQSISSNWIAYLLVFRFSNKVNCFDFIF